VAWRSEWLTQRWGVGAPKVKHFHEGVKSFISKWCVISPRGVTSHQKVPYHHQEAKCLLKRWNVPSKGVKSSSMCNVPSSKGVTPYRTCSRVSYQGRHVFKGINVLLEVWNELSQVVGMDSMKCVSSPSISSKGPRSHSSMWLCAIHHQRRGSCSPMHHENRKQCTQFKHNI